MGKSTTQEPIKRNPGQIYPGDRVEFWEFMGAIERKRKFEKRTGEVVKTIKAYGKTQYKIKIDGGGSCYKLYGKLTRL